MRYAVDVFREGPDDGAAILLGDDGPQAGERVGVGHAERRLDALVDVLGHEGVVRGRVFLPKHASRSVSVCWQ